MRGAGFALSTATVADISQGAGAIDTGQLIAGHYRLVEHIGSGAMGVVWRAIDVRLERSVAVKQILAQPGLSEAERDNMRQRAMREAKNAARFQHPNAIVVFDVAEHGGDPCLVMEYLPGRSLSAILAEQPTLPVGQVARIGEQVASALVAAHRAGIVHRDVKPGNILIDDNGVTKITDFGISRAAGDMALTQTGLIGGTPAYLAPELARGSDPVPSSDVFALGATLYQALEGETPYGNTTNQLALLYAAANGQVNPPKQAGPATALVMSLLRSEPGERPSMAEARDRLAQLAAKDSSLPSGTLPSQQIYGSGTGGRQQAGPDGGARPPWQRTEATAVSPSNPPTPPPRPAPAPTAAWSPPTPPRPAPAQQYPQTPPRPIPAAQNPNTQHPNTQHPNAGRPPVQNPPTPPRPRPAATGGAPGNPDGKRKTAMFAGFGAAVVVVAVIVFVVLNAGGNEKTNNTAGPNTGTSGNSSAPSSGAKPPSSAAAPEGLGKSPSEKITDYGGAGTFLVAFFNQAGSAGSWASLTPAAQAVYGSQQAFTDYWSAHQNPSVSKARADSGGANADGSIDMGLNFGADRKQFRMIKTNGQYLIDANTKAFGDTPNQ